MSTNREARAWLLLGADALLENFARLRAAAGPDARVLPMVKADAYGLGMSEVVRILRSERPWGWGVATLAEGLRLRDEEAIDEAVVVFSPLVERELESALRADLQISVSSLDALAEIVAASRRVGAPAKVHVDVDTGMGRTGFDWQSSLEWMPRVIEAAREEIEWVGCFTHLHSAEDDDRSVREQWARLQEALSGLADAPAAPLIHALNSAGAFAAPEYAGYVIRPGIFLYGGAVGAGHPIPEPVVSLYARVCHVREVTAGTTLGYGATYRASGPERWATLSIGYGDGLPRVLGNRGCALLQGRRVPIIGRISMDLTVVDISDLSGVRVGDVATFLGTEGQEKITLDEIAELAGTISYEILTGFTPRLPRIWA
ncbi:MAG: alanine racemase [Gemmatimonadota bacterium]|nr:alanine racemase [Gemmatimonadota bacterium]